MNYVQKARNILSTKIDVELELLDLYTLLVLTKGLNTTEIDVHDAWSVWCNKNNGGHFSLIPFDELSPEVQAKDSEYCDAIVSTAKILNVI